MAEPTVESVQAELAEARARIKELNGEAAGHRVNWQNALKEGDTLKASFETERGGFTEKLTAAEAKVVESASRAMQASRDAALKLAAKDAGIRDVDGLKLLDTSKIEVAEDGSVTIPEKFFEKAKADRPWLFGDGNTSSTHPMPSPKPAAAKAAKEMTPEEYKIARAEALR